MYSIWVRYGIISVYSLQYYCYTTYHTFIHIHQLIIWYMQGRFLNMYHRHATSISTMEHKAGPAGSNFGGSGRFESIVILLPWNLPGNCLAGLGPNDSRIGLKFIYSYIVFHLIHSSMRMEGMYFHPIRQECGRTNRTNQTIDDHFRMRFTFCQHGLRANSVWANVKSHERVFTVLFSPRIGPTPDSSPQPKLNLAHLRSSPIPSL